MKAKLHPERPLSDMLRSNLTQKSMPAAIRSDFESRSGFSARGVRIVESDLAQAADANAVTQGSTIHFPRGGYAPETGEGRRVLLHELGHTVQQARGEVRPNRADGVNDTPALEHAADAAHSAPGFGSLTGARDVGAPSAMPTAPASAPMQMDKKSPREKQAREQALLTDYAATDDEYQKELGWWGRRKQKKRQEKADKHQDKLDFTDRVRAVEAQRSLHVADTPSPTEEGIGYWEKRRRAKAQKTAQEEAREARMEHMMGDLGLKDDAGYFERRRMRKQVEAAERRVKKQDLTAAYAKTAFAGRMHDSDGTLYDENTRRRLSYARPGAAASGRMTGGGGAPLGTSDYTATQKEIAGDSSNTTHASHAGLGGTLGGIVGGIATPVPGVLANAPEYLAKAGEYIPSLVNSPDEISNRIGPLTGMPLKATGYERFAAKTGEFMGGVGGNAIRGVGGGITAVSGVLSGAASAKRADDARRSGDTASAWQAGLSSASSFLGGGNGVLKGIGKDVIGSAYQSVVPGINIATGTLTAASGIAGVAGAKHTENAMRDMLGQDRYAGGYDAADQSGVEDYEAMRMAKSAAYNRKVASGFDIATGSVDALSGAAMFIPGYGTAISGGLTALSVAGKMGKFATGKALEANSRNKALGEVMDTNEMKMIRGTVDGAGDFSQEEREKMMAKASGASDRGDLHNRMIVRQAVRLHQKISEGGTDGTTQDILAGMGFADPKKYKNISVQQLAEKMGFTGSDWQSVLQDKQQIKAEKRAAEERAVRLKIAKRKEKAAQAEEKARQKAAEKKEREEFEEYRRSRMAAQEAFSRVRG